MEQMKWQQLLSSKRLGRQDTEDATVGRSNFQRDFDRIVFSSAFRRLQDKTQVFPLAKSDFVRTRLTHSLEVSCIGRSLGTEVGIQLQKKDALPKNFLPADVGAIVAAGCLAHDIGNPPFGHAGEDAIRQWFSKNACVTKELSLGQKNDFRLFEGNAQGFRILTRLQNPHNTGGLQLTFATLGAYTKYPYESTVRSLKGKKLGVNKSKHGCFQSEKGLFEEAANELGLIKRNKRASWYCRHPLTLLVEAADDICYRIIDFEDGFRLKHVTLADAKDLFMEIAGKGEVETKVEKIDSDEDKIGYLRAKTINVLISQIASCFMKNEKAILKGSFHKSLIAEIPATESLRRIKNLSKDKVYSAREVLEIEIPGYQVMGGLLETFLEAVNEVAKKKKVSQKHVLLLKLLPDQFLGPERKPDRDEYTRILKVTDFVSGMTDSYAVSLYKQITGISLTHG